MEGLQEQLESLRLVNEQLATALNLQTEKGARLEGELSALRSRSRESGTDTHEEGVPQVKRDISVHNLIKPWSGEADAGPVEDFLNNFSAVACMGNWSDLNKRTICRMKLTGPAAACLSARPELLRAGASFEEYQRVLRERFRTPLGPEYSLLAMSHLSQNPDEGVHEFADRCRKLGDDSLPKPPPGQASDWGRDILDKVSLAAFIKGLRSDIRLPLEYNPPLTLGEAIQRAARIELTHKSVMKCKSVFRVPCDEDTPRDQRGSKAEALNCYTCGRRSHFARDCLRQQEAARPSGDKKRTPGEVEGFAVNNIFDNVNLVAINSYLTEYRAEFKCQHPDLDNDIATVIDNTTLVTESPFKKYLIINSVSNILLALRRQPLVDSNVEFCTEEEFVKVLMGIKKNLFPLPCWCLL